MDSGVTRRELLTGTAALGGVAGMSGCLDRQNASASTPPDGGPPSAREASETYPLVTYESRDGRAVPTMPVNVRVDLTETEADVEAVRDAFRYHPRWSHIVRLIDPYWPFHQSPTQFVWDTDVAGFRQPLASYRYPFLVRKPGGAIGYHVYLWVVREGGRVVGVAGQTHKDIGSLSAHAGMNYDEAAGVVADTFHRSGWQTEWTSFEYGVTASQRQRWGPTGDLVVTPK